LSPRKKTNRVQEIANSDLAATNEQAAQALERAANAEQAAADANLARARIEEHLFKTTN
jgi:hypothetical protein